MSCLTQSVVLFVVGLGLISFGADWLVRGATILAERLGVSSLVIGLTVVAFGTSAPELFVSATASLDGRPGTAVGNIMGSTAANVGLIVGLVVGLELGLDVGARVLSQHARYRPLLASGQHVAASDDAKPAAAQRGCMPHSGQSEPQRSAVSLAAVPLVPAGQLPSIDRT